jgi:hypothetical protein
MLDVIDWIGVGISFVFLPLAFLLVMKFTPTGIWRNVLGIMLAGMYAYMVGLWTWVVADGNYSWFVGVTLVFGAYIDVVILTMGFGIITRDADVKIPFVDSIAALTKNIRAKPKPKATSRSSFVVASEFPDRDQEVLKRYRTGGAA